MLIGNNYDEIVVARLFEFWADHVPWERALWTNGTLGRIQELLELSGTGVPAPALKAASSQVENFVNRDEGLGDTQQRKIVRDRVRGDLNPASVGWHGLSQLLPALRLGYLARWSRAAAPQSPYDAERIARYVAAHLLDCGFSATYLYRWLDRHAHHDATRYTLVDLLDLADRELGSATARDFNVLIPVLAAPRIPFPAPSGWRNATDTGTRIHSWGGNTASLRQNGSFTVKVVAVDRYAAAASALATLDRWNARVELGTPQSLLPGDRVWIEFEPEPIDVRPRRRGVDVPELVGESKLYVDPGNEHWGLRIDDAFQLAQPMESGPRAAGIAGGWAAIESLLTVPGESKHLGAGRMASIVAGSFPRAELTRLAWLHERNAGDTLATDLRGKSNLQRSELIAAHLASGGQLSLRADRDVASQLRMSAMIAAPQPVIRRVQAYVEGTLARLYRHRNLIVHAGLVTGDHRQTLLRSAAPLVGAGFDRIAHAWFVERTDPIQLAARAENNIARVGMATMPITRILEP